MHLNPNQKRTLERENNLKDFTEFTLERVPPLLRDLPDVLESILVLILVITAILAIPIGIIAGGSYIAYKAGLPYNIPLAIGTAALTAIWYFVLIAWFQWTSDSGETWRANKSARDNQEIPEETTEAT